MKKIAFLGLGVMGFPIAGHILKKYGSINVYNRTKSKSLYFKKVFKKYNVSIYNSPKDLAKDSNYIFSCVGNDLNLKEIFFSKNGIINYLNKNTYIIDHSTVSDKTAITCFNKFNSKKCFFIDAPVSGGQIGAINGALSVMVGGEKKRFENIKSILENYSKSLIYMGKSGNGQIAKMVNQICVAGVLQGLSEGLNFGKEKKLKFRDLISAISSGAAGSWQMNNRSETMWNNKFKFGFMNKWMLKDLKIISESARDSNIDISNTKIIQKKYNELVKKGFDELDTSSLIKLLNKKD